MDVATDYTIPDHGLTGGQTGQLADTNKLGHVRPLRWAWHPHEPGHRLDAQTRILADSAKSSAKGNTNIKYKYKENFKIIYDTFFLMVYIEDWFFFLI